MGNTAVNRARRKRRRDSLKWAAYWHGRYVWLLDGAIINQQQIWLMQALVRNGYGLLTIANLDLPKGFNLISYGSIKLKLATNSEVVLQRLNGTLPSNYNSSKPIPPELAGAHKFWKRREAK